MPFKFSLPTAATLALTVVVSPAMLAKPFKWSGSSDIQTRDIHSQTSALRNGIHAAMNQSLVMFNTRTLRVEPLLATSWRRSLYQAIDGATLQRVTMRGMSKPMGAMASPLVNGWTDAVDKRLPYDPNAAKDLLTQAG